MHDNGIGQVSRIIVVLPEPPPAIVVGRAWLVHCCRGPGSWGTVH